jgi:hypothetical protein
MYAYIRSNETLSYTPQYLTIPILTDFEKILLYLHIRKGIGGPRAVTLSGAWTLEPALEVRHPPVQSITQISRCGEITRLQNLNHSSCLHRGAQILGPRPRVVEPLSPTWLHQLRMMMFNWMLSVSLPAYHSGGC